MSRLLGIPRAVEEEVALVAVAVELVVAEVAEAEELAVVEAVGVGLQGEEH